MTRVHGRRIVRLMLRDDDPNFRRLRAGGVTVLGLIAVAIAVGDPGVGAHGRRLGVTLALVVYVVALTGFTLRRRPGLMWPRAATLVALVVASGVLLSLQPHGAAIAGLYAAAGTAGVRARGRIGIVVLAFVVVVADVALVLGGDRSVVDIVADDVGLVMIFLVTRLGSDAREGRERAETLLAELERSRDAQAQAAALRERGRIAREMHDVLAHSLSALAVQLEGTRLLARTRGADAEVVEAIERAHHLAGGGLEEAQRAIGALRGDDLPGPDLLGSLVQSFEEQAGIDCAFEVSGEARPLSSEARLALYRTAQEALTNVRKHADPERVVLRLRYAPEGTSLVVEDHAGANGRGANGRGANGHDPDGATANGQAALAGAGGGYGLSGMRERAELLDGRLAAAPTGDGFRVELWLPAEPLGLGPRVPSEELAQGARSSSEDVAP
jgi:signal transduction histidine kinase